MSTFKNTDGKSVLLKMVKGIQDNKAYLGEVDGLIGDGDHGMNMNKGFMMFGDEFGDQKFTFADGLDNLGNILFSKIAPAASAERSDTTPPETDLPDPLKNLHFFPAVPHTTAPILLPQYDHASSDEPDGSGCLYRYKTEPVFQGSPDNTGSGSAAFVWRPPKPPRFSVQY